MGASTPTARVGSDTVFHDQSRLRRARMTALAASVAFFSTGSPAEIGRKSHAGANTSALTATLSTRQTRRSDEGARPTQLCQGELDGGGDLGRWVSVLDLTHSDASLRVGVDDQAGER